MRLRIKTVLISIIILLLLTILPIVLQGRLTEDIYTYLSKSAGIDLRIVLNDFEILGVVIASTILIGSLFEKTTAIGFALSAVTKIIWIIVAAFVLSLGDLQHIGIAAIGSSGGTPSITVMIDLRLFILLIGIILVMMILYSYLEYREAIVKKPISNVDAHEEKSVT